MTLLTNPRRRATIKDVATAAGVSRQTVSNVVNAPERVAPDTLERVQQVIDSLGYRPSRAAKLLKEERAGAIGLELRSGGLGRLGAILDGFFVGLTEQARHHDAYVVPFSSPDAGAPLAGYEDLIASRIVAAFVLTGTDHNDPRPTWLTENRIPFSSFGRIWDHPEMTNWVDVNGGAGVEQAVAHLADEGYERIGWLGWPEGSPVGDDRRSGWERATARRSVFDETWQAAAPQDIEAAAVASSELIDRIGKGGAVVCASDALAVGAWRALVERGWQVGRDFGLVGFDDSDLAVAVGLTSLRQPVEAAAEHVLGHILAAVPDEDSTRGGGVLLDPHLVVRESSTRSTPSPR